MLGSRSCVHAYMICISYTDYSDSRMYQMCVMYVHVHTTHVTLHGEVKCAVCCIVITLAGVCF